MALTHFDFTNDVVLVSGAVSGIGRATSLAFSRAGAHVVLADVNAEAGKGFEDELNAGGGSTTFFQCDVSCEADVERLIATTVDRYGSLDIAFNNAGIEGTAGLNAMDLGSAEWNRIISVNLSGVWLCLKYELRHMVNRGDGVIVNTSSTAGLAASGGSGVAYAASKHGVIGLTKTAAKEFASHGIRINAICPGPVDTPLLERLVGADWMSTAREKPGGLASPDHIAQAVLWLCSESASFVNGEALRIDGGMMA